MDYWVIQMTWYQKKTYRFDKICECSHSKYEFHMTPGNNPSCDAPHCKCVRFKMPNKYNANRQEYNGIFYDSGREARYAQELDLRKKAGDIKSWERQYRIEIRGDDGSLITKHRVDFMVTLPDGRMELHEVKGYETERYTLLRRIIESVYLPKNPEFIYRVIR